MTAATPNLLFDEIIDFLASAPTMEQLVSYEPPASLQARLSELLDRNRNAELSETDKAELDEFLRMNRFMSRLRLRARQKLSAA